jgi:hypothetical protein
MLQILVGLVAIAGGFYLMSFGFSLWRLLSSRNEIAKLTAGMDSGIYIKHGMTIDPTTGLVTPQQRPSAQAYRHLM